MSSVPLAFAYSYSSAAAYAIAEKHGREGAAAALLRRSTARRSRARPGRKLSDKVVRRTLKTSLKSLEDDVDAYARARSIRALAASS